MCVKAICEVCKKHRPIYNMQYLCAVCVPSLDGFLLHNFNWSLILIIYFCSIVIYTDYNSCSLSITFMNLKMLPKKPLKILIE